MHKIIAFLGACFFCFTLPALAATDSQNNAVAINIPDSYYQHPVRLLHPYLDYWLMRGPLLEKVVRIAMRHDTNNAIEMCGDGTPAGAVLTLEPHLFYNPQSRVFYTEIIASAYTEAAAPLLVIKAEAQQMGELAVTPDFYIQKAYAKAFDKVLQSLRSNPDWLNWTAQHPAIEANALCQSLDDLSATKIYY